MEIKETEIAALSSDYLTRVAIQQHVSSIALLLEKNVLSKDELAAIVKRVEMDQNSIPKEFLLKEELQRLRENHNLTIQTAIAEKMESVASVIAPEIDEKAERLQKLQQAYSDELENGTLENATRLFNQIKEIEQGGSLDIEPEPQKMTAADVVALGFDFVTEYLANFPEETAAITSHIQTM